MRPFPNEIALKFRQRGKQVQAEASVGCRRVNGILKTLQSHPFPHEPVDEVDQMREGTAEPVKFPHHQHIATAQLGQ